MTVAVVVGHMVLPKQQLAGRQQVRRLQCLALTAGYCLLPHTSSVSPSPLRSLPGHHQGHRGPVPGGGGRVRVH